MTVYICDDNAYFADRLAEALKESLSGSFDYMEIQTFTDGSELLKVVETAPPEVAFLDIDMPIINGFALAEEIHARSQDTSIVFVTSLSELVFQSFQYQPLWFLRKTHFAEELPQVIERLEHKCKEKSRTLLINLHGEKRAFPAADILYLESDAHYVQIHTVDDVIRFKAQLNKVEQEINHPNFVRVHVGYLVNCAHMSRLRANTVMLDSGDELPISRSRMAETQQAFMRYMRRSR